MYLAGFCPKIQKGFSSVMRKMKHSTGKDYMVWGAEGGEVDGVKSLHRWQQEKLCSPSSGEEIDREVRADIWQIHISSAVLDVYR